MKRYLFFVLMSTSVLTQIVKAQDDLLRITSGIHEGGPNLNDSMGTRTKSAAKDALSSTVNDVKTQLSTAYKAVRKGGPSTDEVAEHVINYLQTAIQKDFVQQYFKPGPQNDFNVDALQKLFQPVREKVVNLLRTSLLSEGMVAIGPHGQTYPVIRDEELLTLILNKFTPDFPMKGVLLSIGNNEYIKDFMLKKMDQFIIQQCLNMYSVSTGRALKKDVSSLLPLLIGGSVKGAVRGAAALPGSMMQVGQNLMADYKDAGDLSPLSKGDLKLTEEEQQALSKVFEYIEPRLAHFVRETLQTDYINIIIDKAIKAATDPLITKALRADPVSNLGNLGAIAGGIASYVNVPLGLTMAGVGYFSGMYLGHLANYMQQQTKGFVLNQVDIYKKYIAYRLLPITREEYALYHLSDKPSEDLKNLLQDDYAVRQKMTSQSLIWSIIKDLISALRLDSVLQTASTMAQSAGHSLQKLKDYFLKSQPDMMAFSQGQDEIFATDRDKKHQALRKLVGILSKSEQSLSADEKEFLKEATRYPSFDAFQENLDNLNKTIHYLSQNDLQTLKAEQAEKDAKRTQARQKYQHEIRVIHDFVTEIATYYQHSQQDNVESLDWIEVEDVLTHTTNMLPAGFLPLLSAITKDTAFIASYLTQNHNVLDKNYVTSMIRAYENHRYQNEINANKAALDILERDPISEGLSVREQLMLVQKGGHNGLQAPPLDDLIAKEKQTLKTLFNEALAHHIAVDLVNQFEKNKPVIQHLAKQLVSSHPTKEGLIQSMQSAPLFNDFRNYVKELDKDVNVESDIAPQYKRNDGDGFIKQSVYNEMMRVIEECVHDVIGLHTLEKEDDFVVVDKPQPEQENLMKSSWFGGFKASSKKEEPVKPLAVAPTSLTLTFERRPITQLIAYEGSAQEILILATMMNQRLKQMGGSFDLLTQVDEGFMNAVYEDIVKRRSFHVLAEEDVLFLEKYKGYILQYAALKGENIFYSDYTMLQQLREQAKDAQIKALGLQELHEKHENIIE